MNKDSGSTGRWQRGIAISALTVVVLLATLAGGAGRAGAQSAGEAPVIGANGPTAIRDRYIVVFKDDAPGAAIAAARDQASRGGQVHFQYANVLRGLAVTLPAQALDTLRRNPIVDYVEADSTVTIDATQANPTWGLDRIDQRLRFGNGSYTYETTGSGVTAYVIDTGIRSTHADFGGRSTGGFTSIEDGRGPTDCNGHGTHVAGTVGGTTYGVAKAVNLIPVRVLDCNGSGTTAGVIAGIDWVTGHHAAGAAAVANMSLGGGVSQTLDDAVARSITDGITYVVAAGNDSVDACTKSPARAPSAITVGAIDVFDWLTSFSNWGTCVDIFAPGDDITSTWSTSDTATNTIPGTSMASPHVAGVAALYLSANPSASPAAVGQAILNASTPGEVRGLEGSGSPNRIVYNAFVNLSINDVTITEGNSGTTNARFTVTRSGSLTGPSSAQWATADHSATAASGDYASRSGQVTFAANETTKALDVPVNGDLVSEPDEYFHVVLTAPSGARLADGTGAATITNDDAAPATLAINDVSLTEGHSATTNARFTITRSGNVAVAASVSWATADGTATVAGADYAARSGQVSFATNQTTATVDVPVNGDAAVEPDENFSVKLTAPSGATISDDTGVATITNDDTPGTQSFAYTVGNTVSNGVPAPGAGNIESPGVTDRYTFTATAGQKVFVDELSHSTCSLTWSLSGPAAGFASRGICGDPGQITLTTAGTYTLNVTGTVAGTYSFKITDVPAPQASAYTIGTTGNGSIEVPGAVDIHTFTATAGQKVFVDQLTASSCGLNWRLVGPNNLTVFASRGICSVDPGQFTLAAAGTYTLSVDTAATSPATGTYSFKITDVPAPQTSAYTIGTTGNGSIEVPGAVDIHTFTATAGQKVFVDQLTASSCGLNWRLVGPNNLTVFASRGICSVDPGQFTLAAAGTYTLSVDTAATSPATGTYSFKITDVPAPQTSAYTIGTTGNGSIEVPGAVDIHTFTATAGQKVFVDQLTASSCGLNWRLVGPNNLTVFASRGICSVDPGQFTLAAAGTYTLSVDTAATSPATGTYSFKITDVPAPQTSAYTIGTTGNGSIEVPGAVDKYTFNANLNQRLFVDQLTSVSCSLNWRLTDPNGVAVFASRGICSDPGQFVLPATGTYTLTVDTAVTSSATGTYSFKITDVPAPQTSAYTLGTTANGSIEVPGAVDKHTFAATAGQKVFVDQLTSASCSLNWRLTDPNGVAVFASRGICSDPGQQTLAAGGTYTLTVDTAVTSSATGTYSFKITDVPAPQTSAYTIGTTANGSIEVPGAVDKHTFTATAGQRVFVDYITAGSCGINWRLTDPGGVAVFASRGICSDPGQYTLAAAGTYTLTVDTAVTSPATGTYSFKITDVPAPQTSAYALGTTANGNIEVPGAVDRYTFTATAGQKVLVDYLSATTCGLNWRLTDPNGVAVFPSRGICSDPGQFTLAATGTYTLTVDTAVTSTVTGTYSFKITSVV